MNREAELMEALQLLLNRMNTGNIPMSPEMLDSLRRGGAAGQSSANIHQLGSVSVQVGQLMDVCSKFFKLRLQNEEWCVCSMFS